jgi:hypothetical protein
VGDGTADVSGLSAGQYKVTVSDAAGCEAVALVEIGEPGLLAAEIISSEDVSCTGGADGTATVNASGGTGGYSYLWSNGQTTATAAGLSAGIYSVTVSDINSCTSTVSVEIEEPLSGLTAVASIVSEVSCAGGGDGSATVVVSGGTMPYSYLWNTGSTDQTVAGLVSGSYSVVVRDANGCELTSNTIVIGEPVDGVQVSITIDGEPSCAGDIDGSLTASASGGTAGYSYVWSTGATGASVGGLSAGTYSVTATDANGCEAVATVILTDPTGISASISSWTDLGCNGDSDGTATVSATGGTTPYSYLWSNGQTLATATGMSVGSYDVTVSDANGCSAVAVVEIEEPTLLIAEIVSSADVSCAGGADGSAMVNATGGTTPYSYEWSNTQTGATATGLSAILYDVTVTDANGCEAVTSVLIGEPLSVVMEAVTDRPRWV